MRKYSPVTAVTSQAQFSEVEDEKVLFEAGQIPEEAPWLLKFVPSSAQPGWVPKTYLCFYRTKSLPILAFKSLYFRSLFFYFVAVLMTNYPINGILKLLIEHCHKNVGLSGSFPLFPRARL
jgi:hypothetical protein